MVARLFVEVEQSSGTTGARPEGRRYSNLTASAFPSPVKLSAGVTAWNVEDVRAWMAELE